VYVICRFDGVSVCEVYCGRRARSRTPLRAAIAHAGGRRSCRAGRPVVVDARRALRSSSSWRSRPMNAPVPVGERLG
jgi:hypothetical protein